MTHSADGPRAGAVSHPALRSALLRAGLRLVLLGSAMLIFAAMIWWDNAANRGIDSSPAAPVPYTDLRGAVNTYNLHAEPVYDSQGNEIPDNNVRRTFEMIAGANLELVRVQFPWEDIEWCGKGDFVDCRPASAGGDMWAKYDYMVAEAARNGLELMVRLDTPPAWARQAAINSPEIQAAREAGRYPLTGPPDDLNDFGDFVATVAERYRDQVRFFQIWNEPNLPGEWNYREQNPAELVELLRVARDRIKAVHPDAIIVFPALSPTDGLGDGVNDLEYLQGVYEAGGADAFDIMSAQLYGLGQPPSEHRYVRPNISPGNLRESLLRPIDTRTDVSRVVLLREIMERNGDANKPIWVSELGWNSAPPSVPEPNRSNWGQPVSEEVKAQYLIDAVERARGEWPWMGPMFVWMFRFGGPDPAPDDPTPYFALVDRDFSPLPAYDALRNYFADPPPVEPVQRNPFAAAATVVGMGLVIAAGAWFVPALGALLGRLMARPATRSMTHSRGVSRSGLARMTHHTPIVLLLLGLSLAIFYWGSAQLPITALGGAIFLGLALLRPDLALLYVLATVPLYLAPKGIWDERFGIRPEGIRFPLHEFALFCATAGTILDFGLRILDWGKARIRFTALRRVCFESAFLLPLILFAMAGTIGVIVADSRGAALREWRWLIVEPMLFGALVLYWARDVQRRRLIMGAWLLTGVVVAIIGLLQLAGLDLTALLPQSACFSDRVVLAEGGLRRISSVYCHPNNLGLALGRVWPVLAALAVIGGRWSVVGGRWSMIHGPLSVVEQSKIQNPKSKIQKRYVLAALICLAAIGASFSKGAILGAFVALVLIGLMAGRVSHRLAAPLLGLAAIGAIGMIALGLVFGIERLNPLGDTAGARVELWRSALLMIRDHPLTGPGLDQFYHLRTAPEYGNRYIAPEALETTEQFAAHPHNLVLDLLVRVGPLGLLAMAWLVWHFFRMSHRVWDQRRLVSRDGALALGLTAGMAAALTHGLVDNFYFVPDLAFSFWLMLALARDMETRRQHDKVTG